MKKYLSRLCLSGLVLFTSFAAQAQWADLIDTRVGTAHSVTKAAGAFGKGTEELGQTLPAVLTPNGMNFWTPQTRDTEHKCVAPYYYADTLLQGIRNSHWIVGGCTQDYGSFTVMPLTGKLRTQPAERASRFSHDCETAKPYLYETTLPDEGIDLALTGTSRTALLKLKYNTLHPESNTPQKGYLVINPNSDEGEGYIVVDTAKNMIYGYNPVHRIYQGKGEPAGFSGHFIAIPSKKITGYGVYNATSKMRNVAKIGNEPQIGCWVEFDVKPGEEVLVKMSSSYTGHMGAFSNMMLEIPHWDFDLMMNELKKTWEVRLGMIDIEGDDEAKAKFYTAFYHASFLPQQVNDYEGSYCSFGAGYPIMKLPIHDALDRRDLLHNDTWQSAYYDGFSMWDTYRALHPLYALLFPSMTGDMMQSLVDKYEQGGWMPIFPCWNSYTAAMIGDHCASAIADAYLKGVTNFDVEKAYEGLRKNAFEMPTPYEYSEGKGRRALDSYLKYGYIPVEDSVPEAYHKREQTSRTLEYAYDDFALAQLAKALGHEQDYKELMARSKNYANVINPATGYADGRHVDGQWCGDNPFAFSQHITEGAPCHYTWYVPHDPEGLMTLMGGKEAFTQKLDSMFSEHRYWHGNEPCHQIAWMYAYTDKPWGAAKEVRHIMDTEYLNQPGGLAGNDDAGQMSAWYMFAALGFYPVCPSVPVYAIASPSFRRATISFKDGHQLVIEAEGAPDKIYVDKWEIDGVAQTQPFITHDQLMNASTIRFKMKNQ